MHQLPTWTSLTLLLALGPRAVPVRAEIPPEKAVGVYAHTRPERLAQSPFWGMAALKSGVLANIRFFGAYGSTPVAGLPPHPQLALRNNCPQDAIAGVVAYLFPSPDGVNLAHNELDKDPIGGIAAEQRRNRHSSRKTGGLNKIMELLLASAHYQEQFNGAPEGKGSPAPASAGGAESREAAAEAFRAAAYRILDKPNGSASASGEETAFNRIRRQFAALLQAAVLQEATDARRIYPPDTVATALLAYAWRVADDVDELYEAFDGGLLTRPEARQAAMDERAYRDRLEGFLVRMDKGGEDLPSPEELALLLHGYRIYDRPIPDLVPYKTTRYLKDAYPDCGETSLRNFFNILFSRRGEISREVLDAFVSRFSGAEGKAEAPATPGGRLKELSGYYTQYPSLPGHWSDRAHADWSAIVSNLNRDGDPVPIRYRNKGTHNVMGVGVKNMLDLIAHILPDPLLSTRWPDDGKAAFLLAEQKLTQLCVLGSRAGRKLDWSVPAPGGDGTAEEGGQRITRDFLTVAFSLDGAPAFAWHFSDGHFVIRPTDQAGASAWPRRIAQRPKAFLMEAWLEKTRGKAASLLVKDRPCGVFGPDLSHPDDAVEALRFLLSLDAKAYVPTMALLADKSIPFDFNALQHLAYMIYEQYPDAEAGKAICPFPFFLARAQAEKDEMLQWQGTLVVPWMTRLALDHGADANAQDGKGSTVLMQALADGSEQAIDLILQAGARVNARGPRGTTPLHLAAKKPWDPFIERMIEAGADADARDDDGLTPAEAAQRSGHAGTAERIRQAAGAAKRKAAAAGPGLPGPAAKDDAKSGQGPVS